MKSPIIGSLAVALFRAFGFSGCQSIPAQTDDIKAANLHEIGSPAGEGSGQPNLAVGPDDATYLSWLGTRQPCILIGATGAGTMSGFPRMKRSATRSCLHGRTLLRTRYELPHSN